MVILSHLLKAVHKCYETILGRKLYIKDDLEYETSKLLIQGNNNLQIIIKVYTHRYGILYKRLLKKKKYVYEVHGILPKHMDPIVRKIYEDPIAIPSLLPWFYSEDEKQEAAVHFFMDIKNKQIKEIRDLEKLNSSE